MTEGEEFQKWAQAEYADDGLAYRCVADELMADNPDDLRCAQWVIANGSAKRRDGDE